MVGFYFQDDIALSVPKGVLFPGGYPVTVRKGDTVDFGNVIIIKQSLVDFRDLLAFEKCRKCVSPDDRQHKYYDKRINERPDTLFFVSVHFFISSSISEMSLAMSS